MKLSTVLQRAAYKHLSARYLLSKDTWTYSCEAVREAAIALKYDPKSADAFLVDLGVDIHSGDVYFEFEAGPERQGARFLWLLFAAEVAKDEER